MVESLLNSGALNKKAGGRYVVMISDIVNDTTQRIDTRMLTKKIRVAMLTWKGSNYISSWNRRDDTTINATRSARNNSEFNQQTAIKDGQLSINAELGLAGRIMQKSSGNSRERSNG